MTIAIIGAGASGCFAAANIEAMPGEEVVVFEKTGKVMQKVKASGGGRCNVTHECYEIPELITRYPRGKQLLRKTLHQFSPEDTIEWFRARGVELKTETDGRMFPTTDDSQTIIDAIWGAMMRRGVAVRYHKALASITKENERFALQFADGSNYVADRVIVSVGGYPKADQYHWLSALGHSIEPPVPSLFTFNMPGNAITDLMGVSVSEATVKVAGSKIQQSGPLLITHWGMSGPAVLKTSAIGARELADRNYHFTILVNWLHEMTDHDVKEAIKDIRKEAGSQLVANRNSFGLPKRLWEFLLDKCAIGPNTRWGELAANLQNKLIEHLVRDSYEVKGKTTFKEEFVTCGGIKLAEINPQTMESRVHRGLYFAGEVLDVDGITGGYNFQHAWSSAWIAAKSICASEPTV